MGWGARFAGILVAGGVLAGCGGGGAGPEPRVLVAATAEPPASARPAAEVTGGAAGPAEAAGDFVRRWIAAANAAFGTGEVAHWAALNAAGCASCARRVDAVRRTYGEGGRIEGGRLAVSALGVQRPEAGGPEGRSVVAELVAAPERHVAADGSTRSSAGGGPLRLVFYLERAGDGWRVAEIKLGVPG